MTPNLHDKALSDAEVKQLCTYWRTRADEPNESGALTWLVVHLALATGLRNGEMVALTVGDCNLKRRALRVTRLKKARKKKNGDPAEPTKPTWIPIPPTLAEHLRLWIAARALGPTDRLLIGRKGPLTGSGLYRQWCRALDTAGIDARHGIKAARHSLATAMVQRNIHPKLIQAALGHVSAQTTLDMYCGVTFEQQAAAVAGAYADPK